MPPGLGFPTVVVFPWVRRRRHHAKRCQTLQIREGRILVITERRNSGTRSQKKARPPGRAWESVLCDQNPMEGLAADDIRRTNQSQSVVLRARNAGLPYRRPYRSSTPHPLTALISSACALRCALIRSRLASRARASERSTHSSQHHPGDLTAKPARVGPGENEQPCRLYFVVPLYFFTISRTSLISKP